MVTVVGHLVGSLDIHLLRNPIFDHGRKRLGEVVLRVIEELQLCLVATIADIFELATGVRLIVVTRDLGSSLQRKTTFLTTKTTPCVVEVKTAVLLIRSVIVAVARHQMLIQGVARLGSHGFGQRVVLKLVGRIAVRRPILLAQTMRLAVRGSGVYPDNVHRIGIGIEVGL